MHNVLISAVPAFSVGCIVASWLADGSHAVLLPGVGFTAWVLGRVGRVPVNLGVAIIAGTIGMLHGSDPIRAMPRIPDGPTLVDGVVTGFAIGAMHRPPVVFLASVRVVRTDVLIPRVTVQWNSGFPPASRGMRVRVRGWIQATDEGYRIEADSVHPADSLETGRHWVSRVVAQRRKSISRRFHQSLSPVADEVLHSLILGVADRRSELQQNLKVSGGLHLFAVSGLHLGLLLGICLLFPPIGQLPVIPQAVVILGVLLLYAVLSGARPPVVRAFLSVALLLCARLSRRPVDAGWVLFVVAGMVLFIDPRMSRDIGFLMSFAALAGIVFLARPMIQQTKTPTQRWLLRKGVGRLKERIVASTITSVAATLAIAPITVLVFQGTSILSPFTSLLLLPFVIWLMLAAPVIMTFPQLGILAEGPAHAVNQLAKQLARFPHVFHETPHPSEPAAIVHIAVLLLTATLLVRCREGRRLRLFLWPILSLTLLIATSQHQEPPSILIVDTGDSRAAICIVNETCIVIAPCGQRQQDAGVAAVARELKRIGISVVDRVFVRDRTDATARFARGLRQACTVTEVVYPASKPTSHDVRAIQVEFLGEGHVRAGILVSWNGRAALGMPSPESKPAAWPKLEVLVLPTLSLRLARQMLAASQPARVIAERDRPSAELQRCILQYTTEIERPSRRRCIEITVGHRDQ